MIDVHLLTSDDYQSITQKIEALEGKIAQLIQEKHQVKRREFLTVKEFLEILQISRGTFENMKKETDQSKFKVNFLKRGNRIYIPETEVRRYYEFY